MNFIDFNRNKITKDSFDFTEDFKEYIMGNQVTVTAMKKFDENLLVAKTLSSDFSEDKFMVKYSPNNKIYFSNKFLSTENEGNFASCYIDEETCSVYIGSAEEFPIKSGVLVFSGVLSLNNMVERDRDLYCNDRVLSTFKHRVKILSLGVRGDKLFGLYLVPSERGIAVGVDGANNLGISTSSLKVRDCSAHNKFSIIDWFKNAKIMEV